MTMLQDFWRMASDDGHPRHALFHLLSSLALVSGNFLLQDVSVFGRIVLLVLTVALGVNALRAIFLLKAPRE